MTCSSPIEKRIGVGRYNSAVSVITSIVIVEHDQGPLQFTPDEFKNGEDIFFSKTFPETGATAQESAKDRVYDIIIACMILLSRV